MCFGEHNTAVCAVGEHNIAECAFGEHNTAICAAGEQNTALIPHLCFSWTPFASKNHHGSSHLFHVNIGFPLERCPKLKLCIGE